MTLMAAPHSSPAVTGAPYHSPAERCCFPCWRREIRPEGTLLPWTPVERLKPWSVHSIPSCMGRNEPPGIKPGDMRAARTQASSPRQSP